MKNKLSFISIFTLCIALSLTACGGKQASTTDSKNTQTEAGSEASGKSDSRLDDLYQQENQLFADHADVWNKAFGMMNKSDADPNGNYADYLAGTVESNKDSFTDDELKTLNEDIETIRKIEEQIAELENKNKSSDDNKKDSSKASSVFSDFSGEDFDGNKVDDSLFSGNAVTVVNFWFTGCKPCVAELSKLNELNDAIKSMGGEVIGINSSKYSDTTVEGMGYAIPITAVQDRLDDLMNRQTREKVDESEKGYLGISCATVSSDVSEAYGIPEGVLVTDVASKSAAEKAGIKANYVITKIDGQSISSAEELTEKLNYYAVGETVPITYEYLKDDAYVEKTVDVTLMENPNANNK